MIGRHVGAASRLALGTMLRRVILISTCIAHTREACTYHEDQSTCWRPTLLRIMQHLHSLTHIHVDVQHKKLYLLLRVGGVGIKSAQRNFELLDPKP